MKLRDRRPGTEGTAIRPRHQPHSITLDTAAPEDLEAFEFGGSWGLRLLNRSVSLAWLSVKINFVADMKRYRAVQVDDAGDSWSVLVSEDGGTYEWLPVTYYTIAAAEAAIVRFKQAEAGATFSRERAATPAWIRKDDFAFDGCCQCRGSITMWRGE